MTKHQILLPPEVISALDAWRAKQPGVPNRSEAIRRLIMLGGEAGKPKDEKK